MEDLGMYKNTIEVRLDGICACVDVDKLLCPMNISMPNVFTAKEAGESAEDTLNMIQKRKYYLRQAFLELSDYVEKELRDREGTSGDVIKQLNDQVMTWRMIGYTTTRRTEG